MTTTPRLRLVSNLPRAELTRWPRVASNRGERVETSWEQFLDELTLMLSGPFLDAEHPCWSAAVFSGNRRGNEQVERVTALVLDYDRDVQPDVLRSVWGNYYGLLHTTRSNTPDAPRCRVILPLARAVSPSEYAKLWQAATRFSSQHGLRHDDACKDPARLWYMPGGGAEAWFAHLAGQVMSPDSWLQEAPSAPPVSRGPDNLPNAEMRAIAYLDHLPPAIQGQNGSGALWKAAHTVTRGFAISEEAAFRIIKDVYNPRCVPPWNDREIRHKISDAAKSEVLPLGYLRDARREYIPSDDEIGAVPPPAPSTALQDWQVMLAKDGRGQFKNIPGNVALVLANDKMLQGCLAWDEFRSVIFWERKPPGIPGMASPEQGEEIADHHVPYILHIVEQYVRKASIDTVRQALEPAARANPCHTVRDYLTELRWDGKPRCDRWLIDYLGAEDNHYHRRIGALWAISAVARIMQPGCQVDYMLILEGAQGAGKTSVVRALANGWYLPNLPPISDKDAMAVLRGNWVVEMGELDALRGTEWSAIKSFLTCREDYFRPAYAKFPVRWKRECVFIGTTNEHQYLHDPSGSRRFWPVACHRVDPAAAARDRDQIWAEALHRFHSGEQWWPEKELESHLAEEQEQRFAFDVWEEVIRDWLGGRKETTIHEVLRLALSIETAKQGKSEQIRVGNILRRLGYRRSRPRSEGGGRVYLKE